LEARVIERTDQIERQTAWLETIVCEAQEAIIVTDEAGTVRLINDAALSAFGVKESAALGVSLPKLMGQVIRETFTMPALADESRGEIEVNGRFYLYSTTGIRPDETEVNGYICILSDVTPLHRLNMLKTQVIRMASHDLRSPLTALRLHHYLLRKHQGSLNDVQQNILNQMESSISDMQRMIDEMLNLDYIENQAQGRRDAISVDTLLASSISLLTPQIEIKNQRVETKIMGDIPPICGDPVRLLEAIRNYLTNAIKYTPDGGTISACVYADMQQVHVKIIDNGIGIDVVDLDHVFESRFRAQTALATIQEGKGIGLSLVKAIIEEHGGQVWAESQPGLGSTFGFSLPIDQSCLLDNTK
jgi:PAS domain S-box-containing protein